MVTDPWGGVVAALALLFFPTIVSMNFYDDDDDDDVAVLLSVANVFGAGFLERKGCRAHIRLGVEEASPL